MFIKTIRMEILLFVQTISLNQKSHVSSWQFSPTFYSICRLGQKYVFSNAIYSEATNGTVLSCHVGSNMRAVITRHDRTIQNRVRRQRVGNSNQEAMEIICQIKKMLKKILLKSFWITVFLKWFVCSGFFPRDLLSVTRIYFLQDSCQNILSLS